MQTSTWACKELLTLLLHPEMYMDVEGWSPALLTSSHTSVKIALKQHENPALHVCSVKFLLLLKVQLLLTRYNAIKVVFHRTEHSYILVLVLTSFCCLTVRVLADVTDNKQRSWSEDSSLEVAALIFFLPPCPQISSPPPFWAIPVHSLPATCTLLLPGKVWQSSLNICHSTRGTLTAWGNGNTLSLITCRKKAFRTKRFVTVLKPRVATGNKHNENVSLWQNLFCISAWN